MSKILFLTSIEFNILKDKFGEEAARRALLIRDELGFFNHVYHVHFPTTKSQVIELNDRHTVIEVGREKFKLFKKIKILFNLLNTISFLWQIMSLIRRENVDIIRSIDPAEQGVYGYILAKMTGKAWCVSLHADRDLDYKLSGGSVLFGSRNLTKRIERFVFKRAPSIIAISEYIAKWAVANGAREEKIKIIYNSIDTEFLLREQQDFPTNLLNLRGKKVIAFVGRLSREKYIYDVLDIAEELLKIRKDVIFLIIGGGPEERQIKITTVERGLSDFVKLMGPQSNEIANKIRQSCDVNLCLLSGYSLVEAAISGKPIVAYDVEWHNELIENNFSGILIPESKVEEAAKAINLLLESPDLSIKLAEKAKIRALESHSIEKNCQLRINYYKGLMKNKTTPDSPLIEIIEPPGKFSKVNTITSLKRFVPPTIKRYLHNSFAESTKKRIVRENLKFFNVIHLETRTLCNNTCAFCPAAIQFKSRKDRSMSNEVFHKAINELSSLNYDGRISLYGNNEPLIEPRIFEFIKIVKDKCPKSTVEIKTNGKVLNIEKLKILADSGLDHLLINDYNHLNDFSDNIKQIIRFLKGCGFKGSSCRLIHIEHRNINAVMQNRAGSSPNKKALFKPWNCFCFRPFHMAILGTEGQLGLCCNDFDFRYVVANIHDVSLVEAWNSEKMRIIREKLLNNDRTCASICKACDFGGYWVPDIKGIYRLFRWV